VDPVRLAAHRPRRGRRLPAFTALGRIEPGEACQADMGGGFTPKRRNVAWRTEARDAPIRPLLVRVGDHAPARHGVGQVFRRGAVQVSRDDVAVIATAMGVEVG
jgi:hypothetical protein